MSLTNNLKQKPDSVQTSKKAHEFFKLYKTDEETSQILKRFKNTDDVSSTKNAETSKSDQSSKQKNKESTEVSLINNLSSQVKDTKMKMELTEVKPIIKKDANNISLDKSNADTIDKKRKKRNKSVSFQLDDNEVTISKKSKTDLDIPDKVTKKAFKKNKTKFTKHVKKDIEKENVSNMQIQNSSNIEGNSHKKKIKVFVNKKGLQHSKHNDTGDTATNKKTNRTNKDRLITESLESSSEHQNVQDNSNKTENGDQKIKKRRHQKKKKKSIQTEKVEITEESKSNEVQPEVIADNLENLTIGDNPDTITNLLDEMVVADKSKKKKSKGKFKTGKTKTDHRNSDATDLEHIEEGKEKVSWVKRRWNKGNRIESNINIQTSVIVENLPFSIMIDYKKKLQEHFSKLGLIKFIGPIELYTTEDAEPVFTTTVHFYGEDSATQAIKEDNTIFEGSTIRVKRPLPPTLSTLVVRSYGDLTEQALSSIFLGAGRIRNIRFPVKGKKSICTAFVEFDCQEAVEKAISMAAEAKIGGKKIHVSKFEQRQSKKPKLNGDVQQNNEKMHLG